MTRQTLYPLVFEPIFKELVWGGHRFAQQLGKSVASDRPIGESWEVVDLPGEQSVVAQGRLAGVTLQQLVHDHKDALLGPIATDGGRFPLLVKYIDAADTLSVQVHPDEASAQRLGGRAKNEAWYILHADPGAKLYLGLKPGTTPEAFRVAVEDGTLEQLLLAVEPKPGELYPVSPGTVHAIGAGILLAEVQQPSDTTYRIYDWGRVGLDGKPRELHVAQSLEATDYEATPGPAAGSHDAGHFHIDVVRGSFDDDAPQRATGPMVVVGLGDPCTLVDREGQRETIMRGRVVLVPHCCRPARLHADGETAALVVTFPETYGGMSHPPAPREASSRGAPPPMSGRYK